MWESMLRTLIEVSFDKIDDSNSSKLCLIAYPFSLQNPKLKFYEFNFRGIGYGAGFRVQITYRWGMYAEMQKGHGLGRRCPSTIGAAGEGIGPVLIDRENQQLAMWLYL
jgi:hypothetical protein